MCALSLPIAAMRAHCSKSSSSRAAQWRLLRLEEQTMNIAFKTTICISAFMIAIFSLAMPWKMRCAFAHVLLKTVDKMMKNSVILRVALDVRWKK